MPYLGAFEQLILFSVLQLEDGAYGVSIRENIEERTGRTVSIGAICTTLGRLEERGARALADALQVGIGLALGVGWGWVLLNEDRNDITLEVGNIPLTLALTAAVAACVCALACAYPTLRGLRIQPTEALRES